MIGDTPQPGETPRTEGDPWSFADPDAAWWRGDTDRTDRSATDAPTARPRHPRRRALQQQAAPAGGTGTLEPPITDHERTGAEEEAHAAAQRDVVAEFTRPAPDLPAVERDHDNPDPHRYDPLRPPAGYRSRLNLPAPEAPAGPTPAGPAARVDANLQPRTRVRESLAGTGPEAPAADPEAPTADPEAPAASPEAPAAGQRSPAEAVPDAQLAAAPEAVSTAPTDAGPANLTPPGPDAQLQAETQAKPDAEHPAEVQAKPDAELPAEAQAEPDAQLPASAETDGPDVMVLPEPDDRTRPTVALERGPAAVPPPTIRPRQVNPSPDPLRHRPTEPLPRPTGSPIIDARLEKLENSPFWQDGHEEALAGTISDRPAHTAPRRIASHRGRPTRRPLSAHATMITLGLIAAFFAWVSAEPFWLAVGHGDRGYATTTTCTGDSVTQRCTGRFASADGRYTIGDVTLLGVEQAGREPGSMAPARMVSPDSRQAYVGGTGWLVHLRWLLGFALVLVCGYGIAGATGARRLENPRARRTAVLLSLAGPLSLLAGFLAAAY